MESTPGTSVKSIYVVKISDLPCRPSFPFQQAFVGPCTDTYSSFLAHRSFYATRDDKGTDTTWAVLCFTDQADALACAHWLLHNSVPLSRTPQDVFRARNVEVLERVQADPEVLKAAQEEMEKQEDNLRKWKRGPQMEVIKPSLPAGRVLETSSAGGQGSKLDSAYTLLSSLAPPVGIKKAKYDAKPAKPAIKPTLVRPAQQQQQQPVAVSVNPSPASSPAKPQPAKTSKSLPARPVGQKPDAPPVVPPKAENPASEKMRQAARNILRETLSSGIEESDEGASELATSLANDIEHEIFSLLGSNGKQYSEELRKLGFNLRQNKPLMQRVLSKEVLPHALVRMSPEELDTDEHKAERQRIEQLALKQSVLTNNPEDIRTLEAALQYKEEKRKGQLEPLQHWEARPPSVIGTQEGDEPPALHLHDGGQGIDIGGIGDIGGIENDEGDEDNIIIIPDTSPRGSGDTDNLEEHVAAVLVDEEERANRKRPREEEGEELEGGLEGGESIQTEMSGGDIVSASEESLLLRRKLDWSAIRDSPLPPRIADPRQEAMVVGAGEFWSGELEWNGGVVPVKGTGFRPSVRTAAGIALPPKLAIETAMSLGKMLDYIEETGSKSSDLYRFWLTGHILPFAQERGEKIVARTLVTVHGHALPDFNAGWSLKIPHGWQLFIMPPTEEACTATGIPRLEADFARTEGALLVLALPTYWGVFLPKGSAEPDIAARVTAAGAIGLHRIPRALDYRFTLNNERFPQVEQEADFIFGEEVRLFPHMSPHDVFIFRKAADFLLESGKERTYVTSEGMPGRNKELLLKAPRNPAPLPSAQRGGGPAPRYMLFGCWSTPAEFPFENNPRLVYRMREEW